MNDYKEFAWDDEISEEDGKFILLPEGDYEYTVSKVERARFAGSEKTPACNMAKVTFTVWGPTDKVEINENFLLYSKFEWKLSQLFLSVGMKKHGEPLRMNWTSIIGKRGKCNVYVDKYKNKNGEDRQSNKIKKFYAYDEDVKTLSLQTTQPTQYQQYQPVQQPPQTTQPSGWQPGKF